MSKRLRPSSHEEEEEGVDEQAQKRAHLVVQRGEKRSREDESDVLERSDVLRTKISLPEIPYSTFRAAGSTDGDLGNPFFEDDFEQDGVLPPEEAALSAAEQDYAPNDVFDDLVLDSVAMSHNAVFEYLKRQADFKKQQLAPEKRHVRAQKGAGKATVLKGSVRIDRIRRLLSEAFTDDQGKLIRRSEPQQNVHEVYIRACLPKIYDDEWDDNREHIMKKFGITRLQMWVLVVMARREGKTWGMAMFIAAMVLSVADIEISIFATCKRTAEKLLKVFNKFLIKAMDFIPEEEFVIIKKTQETIIIMGPDGTERIIGCYPASVRYETPSSLFLTFPSLPKKRCVCVQQR